MSEIKDIPEHWEVKKLGEVVDKLSLNKIKIKQSVVVMFFKTQR